MFRGLPGRWWRALAGVILTLGTISVALHLWERIVAIELLAIVVAGVWLWELVLPARTRQSLALAAAVVLLPVAMGLSIDQMATVVPSGRVAKCCWGGLDDRIYGVVDLHLDDGRQVDLIRLHGEGFGFRARGIYQLAGIHCEPGALVEKARWELDLRLGARRLQWMSRVPLCIAIGTALLLFAEWRRQLFVRRSSRVEDLAVWVRPAWRYLLGLVPHAVLLLVLGALAMWLRHPLGYLAPAPLVVAVDLWVRKRALWQLAFRGAREAAARGLPVRVVTGRVQHGRLLGDDGRHYTVDWTSAVWQTGRGQPDDGARLRIAGAAAEVQNVDTPKLERERLVELIRLEPFGYRPVLVQIV